MKKLLLSFLILTSLNSLLAQQWVQKRDIISSPCRDAVGFNIGNKGYICTGLRNMISDSLYEYNQATNSWSSKAAFPGTSRYSAISFSFPNFAIVGLGWNGTNTLNDCYKYSQITDIWSPVSNYPGNGGRNSVSATVNNLGYVTGGTINSITPYSKQLWEYNSITDLWVRKKDFPQSGRAAATMFAIDSLVYYGLGHSNSTNHISFWSYNVNSDSWSQISNFPGQGRYKAVSFVINGRAIVGGGRTLSSGTPLNDYYEYDPLTSNWSIITNFNGPPRHSAVSFSLGNFGYISTGQTTNSNTYTNDLWEYSTNTVGLIKTFNSNNIEVFPNPSSRFINVDISKIRIVNAEYKLFNSDGKLVKMDKILNTVNMLQIDLNQISDGIYYLNISDLNNNFISKIIIHK